VAVVNINSSPKPNHGNRVEKYYEPYFSLLFVTYIHSVPGNPTGWLTGASFLNLLIGLPLTGLLVKHTPRCPDIKICVLCSR